MNLALFDFDGRITRSDTFSRFIRFAVRPSRIAAGRVLLGPVVLGYRLHLISASQARRAVARFGFRGEHTGTVRRLGIEYATNVLPGTVRRGALKRIAWHTRQGDEVVVVSASLGVYVRPWCEGLGVHSICTELEEQDGRLTGRYRCGDCTGAEKLRRILAEFPPDRYSLIYGYGDTEEDREMLELAHRKYYRWREIGDWAEAVARDRPANRRLHSTAARTDAQRPRVSRDR